MSEIRCCEDQTPPQIISLCFLAIANLFPLSWSVYSFGDILILSPCVLSPACLPTLCLSVSMSISSSSAWAHSGSHYLFLFVASTSSPEAPLDFFITSTTPLLPEKSFMFSKIIPYPWLPLFSAQSCISFSNYIRSKSLSTSLIWFFEHLLSLTLLCATPVFPGSYLNLFIGFLLAQSWDFSHLWDGR